MLTPACRNRAFFTNSDMSRFSSRNLIVIDERTRQLNADGSVIGRQARPSSGGLSVGMANGIGTTRPGQGRGVGFIDQNESAADGYT